VILKKELPMTNPTATRHQDETVNDFVVDAFDTVVIALTGFLAMVAFIAVV
jgi:hypothetical protein